MANSSPVYDPESETGSGPTYRTPPDLGPGHSSPAGNSSDPRGDLRRAEKRGKPSTGSSSGGNLSMGSGSSGGSSGSGGSFSFNPKGEEEGATKAGLAAAEAGTSTAGGGNGLFNDNDNGGRLGGLLRTAKRNRKKALIGGGASAGIVGLLVAGFLMLIPLKIEHIVTNLQNHFMSTSNSAAEQETQTIFKGYIEQKVLPAYKSCGTTRSKDCTPKNFGDGPIGNLYQTWSNNKLENKLADDYGIEFKFDTASNTWKLKTSGNSEGIDIGSDGSGFDQEFNSRSSARSAITASLNDAIQNETKWKSVMIRYKTGRLLEEKYGIKRCIIFCGKKDALGDKIDTKKKAAQLKLVQRVLKPRTQTMGTVLECVLDPSCDPNKADPQAATDGENAQEAGGPESDTQKTVESDGRAAADKFASESADQLLQDYNTISEKGFQSYLIEQVLGKIGLSEISDKATTAVPIVGWANQAANMVTAINNAGPKLKTLSYIVNSTGAVQMYMMYRTYADEIHTGNVNATEVGSLVDSLGAGSQGPSSDPEVGGTASAENTPLYKNLIDGDNTRVVSSGPSLLSSLASTKAYADSPATVSGDSTTTPNQYKCNNGSPPSGLVCSESVLGTGNGLANSAHAALNTPPLNVITGVSGIWSSTIGKIFGTIGSWATGVITAVPGVTPAMDSISGFVSGVIQPFTNFITNQLLPNPFGSNMSGGSKVVEMAAGADITGADNAHSELGGHVLKPQQVADIMSQQEGEAKQQFTQQSFFARMFGTDSQYSLISKLAMDMPLSKQAAIQTSFASILNPLNILGHGFGSVLSGNAHAADNSQTCAMSPAVGDSTDCLGVTPQGWTSDEIAALGNANQQQAYWDAHCSNDASKAYTNDNSWNMDAANGPKDPASGMPQNTTGNPCLLIMGTVGSAGGYMDASNLTSDDLADQNGSSGTGSTPPTTGAPGQLPTGSAQQLAQQIKPYIQSGKIQCLTSGCPDIVNTASGTSIKGGEGCEVDALKPGLLGMILGLLQDGHTFILSALCSDHHDDGITLHAGGTSADFNTIDGVFMGPSPTDPWTSQKIQVGQKLDEDALALVGRDKIWFGQIQCHPIFSFQHDPPDFDDYCHHQHITVTP